MRPRNLQGSGDVSRKRTGMQAVPAGFVHFRVAHRQTLEPVFCPHFGPCGGCDQLDIAYADECHRKEEGLRALAAGRPFLAQTEFLPLLAAAQPLFWRTSLKIPLARRSRRIVCGFYEPGSHRIVDLKTCVVQHPVLVALVRATRELASRLGVAIYDEVAHRGVLRHLVARVAPSTGEILVGLVVRDAGNEGIRRLAGRLWRRFGTPPPEVGAKASGATRLVGIVENVNPERTNVVLGSRSHTLAGRAWLVERADGLEVHTSLDSFVQANPAQASQLYAEILRTLGDVRGRRILELYAGYAPIGLRLARAGAQVRAVERNRAAVRVGSEATGLNALEASLQIVASTAEAALDTPEARDVDTIIVDPPRRGLTPEVVERLLERAAPTLIYVSCNPKSLFRDLERLTQRFAVRTLRGVDLFPRTNHVEVVAHLERVT